MVSIIVLLAALATMPLIGVRPAVHSGLYGYVSAGGGLGPDGPVTQTILHGGTVEVHKAAPRLGGGERVAVVRIEKDGSYSVDLKPGRYVFGGGASLDLTPARVRQRHDVHLDCVSC